MGALRCIFLFQVQKHTDNSTQQDRIIQIRVKYCVLRLTFYSVGWFPADIEASESEKFSCTRHLNKRETEYKQGEGWSLHFFFRDCKFKHVSALSANVHMLTVCHEAIFAPQLADT